MTRIDDRHISESLRGLVVSQTANHLNLGIHFRLQVAADTNFYPFPDLRTLQGFKNLRCSYRHVAEEILTLFQEVFQQMRVLTGSASAHRVAGIAQADGSQTAGKLIFTDLGHGLLRRRKQRGHLVPNRPRQICDFVGDPVGQRGIPIRHDVHRPT